MASKKRKLIDSKSVAKLLKVNPELINYLRQHQGLPFTKVSKYILFSEAEVIRWRNKRLTKNAECVMDLREYYDKIHLSKFISYEDFKRRVSDEVFLEGDSVLQYIPKYNEEKVVKEIVGDIISEYWDSKKPKCVECGRTIISTLGFDKCHICRKKEKLDPKNNT